MYSTPSERPANRQKRNKKQVKLLIQAGDLGGSVIDHLIGPAAGARNIREIDVFCHHRGPQIANLKYHCPPGILARCSVTAVLYEYALLFWFALFSKSSCIAGYLLNPHGVAAFIIAGITRKNIILALIAGRAELYTKGSIQGIDFEVTPLPLWGRIYLKMLKAADAVITTGKVTRDYLVKRGVKEEKIFPMSCPPNKQRFHPETISRQYDVISVGYLSRIKHQEVLLKAAAEIRKKYPDIRVCFAGNGPARHELESLAKKSGITDNIVFAGYQQNMPFYYNSARVFVHTSEREGFPNVVVEAMACGLPCVISDCGDIVDVARDGYNSLVITNYDDYLGFAKGITSLLENKELYRRLAQNALSTIESMAQKDITRQWESMVDSIKPR